MTIPRSLSSPRKRGSNCLLQPEMDSRLRGNDENFSYTKPIPLEPPDSAGFRLTRRIQLDSAGTAGFRWNIWNPLEPPLRRFNMCGESRSLQMYHPRHT